MYMAAVLDPVCGMTVDPERTPHRAEHGGEAYYFCNPKCRTRFVAEPERFLTPGVVAPPTVDELGREYTCPMHPEVVQNEPGRCPKCGMPLELRQAAHA